MEQILLDTLTSRVEKLLTAYQDTQAENRRLQDQIRQMEEQQQTVRHRVDALLAMLEGVGQE